MAELWRIQSLRSLTLWVLLAFATIFLRLLPLATTPGDWPGPDMLAAITLAWVVRRPAHLPFMAIALVFLLEDLFLLRPPGLGALIMLLGTEFLRRRASVVRELNLLLEWGMVAAVQVAMFVAYRFALAIVMAPRPPLDLSLIELVFTILFYPVAVVILQSLFRVRKPAMGELDELGRKL